MLGLLVFGLLSSPLPAQDCTSQLVEDRIVNGTHLLRTAPQTMVVRGNYTYSLELLSDERGITARVFSKGGVVFREDDEIIFIDVNSLRRSYRFFGRLITEKEGSTPVHSNFLQLDLEAIRWLAAVNLQTLYIKDNVNNEMRKFTVNAARQEEFRRLTSCFYETLDHDQLGGQTSTEAAQKGPVSATRSSSPSTESGAGVSDEERRLLEAELMATKEQLRRQIAAEQAKAARVIGSLQEEVALAREQAMEQKERYAAEVLAAREASLEAIEAARQSEGATIEALRERARREQDTLLADVAAARERAVREMETARLHAAREVAEIRQAASAELAAVREQQELARLEYRDAVELFERGVHVFPGLSEHREHRAK